MKSRVEQPVALVCTFTWLGCILAISFLEAWLKFRAPGVTLPIGLGIGRLVFDALNKVEWVFALAIVISSLCTSNKFSLKPIYLVTLIMLIAQTVWLLPALDARAELYITGKTVASSYLHFYYVIAEGIKFITLFIFGIKLFKLEKT